jgi:hypothetical protein
MKLFTKLALLALPVLAACGGGGSSSQTCASDLSTLTKSCTSNVSTAIPEGIWYGATTTELAAQTIVLENGQYFSVYTSSGSGAFQWLTEGFMTASNNAITDTATIALTSTNALIGGSASGSFTAKSSLAMTTTMNTVPNTTVLSYNGAYNSIYDSALNISDVSGATWTSPATLSTVSTITFQADGTASGAQGTCTFTGSFKPRSTGKHLLDGTLNFTNATCLAGNGVSMPVEATVVNSQLTIVGVTPQRNAAFYLTARR